MYNDCEGVEWIIMGFTFQKNKMLCIGQGEYRAYDSIFRINIYIYNLKNKMKRRDDTFYFTCFGRFFSIVSGDGNFISW